jgi:CBS domain-containing protein
MNILDLCDRQTAVVPVQATVAEAITVMLSCHVGGVAVVDQARRVAGIFTERDVLIKVALGGHPPSHTPVRELMTSPVQTASPAISPGEALTTMLEGHFRHLPIVDSYGRLLGILSLRHLLQWRADDLSHELDALEQYFANDSLGG